MMTNILLYLAACDDDVNYAEAQYITECAEKLGAICDSGGVPPAGEGLNPLDFVTSGEADFVEKHAGEAARPRTEAAAQEQGGAAKPEEKKPDLNELMLVSLVIFMLTVREPKFVEEMHAQSQEYGLQEAGDDTPGSTRGLSRGEKVSLGFILASIVLWFMGYNAVTSKYSVYASNILHKDFNLTLIIAQAAAILSYLPVGMGVKPALTGRISLV